MAITPEQATKGGKTCYENARGKANEAKDGVEFKERTNFWGRPRSAGIPHSSETRGTKKVQFKANRNRKISVGNTKMNSRGAVHCTSKRPRENSSCPRSLQIAHFRSSAARRIEKKDCNPLENNEFWWLTVNLGCLIREGMPAEGMRAVREPIRRTFLTLGGCLRRTSERRGRKEARARKTSASDGKELKNKGGYTSRVGSHV